MAGGQGIGPERTLTFVDAARRRLVPRAYRSYIG
jgi:hypothetical protein